MRLKQIRPDVVIEVYFRIAFRKDASFKGMIISQTEPLIAEGLTFILGEM